MTDALLTGNLIVLCLILLFNVLAWSRQSVACNRVVFWAHKQANALKLWRARRRRR